MGKIIGQFEKTIEYVLAVFIEEHNRGGIQAFNCSKERVLNRIPHKYCPSQETYVKIINSIEEYIEKNHHSMASRRCTPGTFRHEPSRLKLIEYVKERFQ